MTTQNSRTHAWVLLHVLMLSVLSTASPSGSAPTLDIEDVASSDLRIIEDVSRWVEGDTGTSSVRDQLRERGTGFEVFRSYHDDELRLARLANVPYAEFIGPAAHRHGVDPLLLAAIAEVESSFDPTAVSHRGAVGLMQVLPSTAQTPTETLVDPGTNVDRGARYLRRLLDRFDGDLELALAAYNAGPTNVRRYGGVPPFRETRAYVEKVLRIYVEHHRAVWQASEDVTLLTGSAADETFETTAETTTETTTEAPIAAVGDQA